MFKGLGTDILSVARIQKSIDKHGESFLEKVFTAAEIAYCQKHSEAARHFCGRFAAKEAVVKALGTGFRDGVAFHDIEVVNDANGKPSVQLVGKVAEIVGDGNIHISISHCREYATATAVWVEKG